MKKYRVSATVPTAYQFGSLQKFGMETTKHGNGSFSAFQDFDTEEEAKEYLKERARMYYDETPEQADEHIVDIEKYGSLTIDAATARIEELDEAEVTAKVYPSNVEVFFSVNGENVGAKHITLEGCESDDLTLLRDEIIETARVLGAGGVERESLMRVMSDIAIQLDN